LKRLLQYLGLVVSVAEVVITTAATTTASHPRYTEAPNVQSIHHSWKHKVNKWY